MQSEGDEKSEATRMVRVSQTLYEWGLERKAALEQEYKRIVSLADAFDDIADVARRRGPQQPQESVETSS